MLPLPCMLVCSFVCANRTRDRGCSKHPVFPAPSDKEGGKLPANLGRNAPRDRRLTFNCHRPRRRRSSIPEAAVIEPIGHGVLDAPPSRGMTALVWPTRNRQDEASVPQLRSACRPLKVKRLGSRTP